MENEEEKDEEQEDEVEVLKKAEEVFKEVSLDVGEISIKCFAKSPIVAKHLVTALLAEPSILKYLDSRNQLKMTRRLSSPSYVD